VKLGVLGGAILSGEEMRGDTFVRSAVVVFERGWVGLRAVVLCRHASLVGLDHALEISGRDRGVLFLQGRRRENVRRWWCMMVWEMRCGFEGLGG
jgi:hypothetical protein